LSRTGAEAKPAWAAVPPAVRDAVATLLGSPVARADRAYGGYAPSATFRTVLRDGRRVFLKGTYPLPRGSHVQWTLLREERVYRGCAELMGPWAPRFLGSVRREGWHLVALEDLGAAAQPPWTAPAAHAAMRSFARFHAGSIGRPLPRWLDRDAHAQFAGFWTALGADGTLGGTAGLAGRRAAEAEEWLDVALPVLRAHAERLRRLRRPFAFLHVDTRSDNLRLQRGRLRLFDWNFAAVGPHEFDAAAFAQSIAMEGGPAPEDLLAAYARVLPLRDTALDACVAGIAGYFADRAWRPAPAGLPRLRSVQRRQLKASLGWAARRFDLPEPRWLAAVRD
jgi:hypothetical protein